MFTLKSEGDEPFSPSIFSIFNLYSNSAPRENNSGFQHQQIKRNKPIGYIKKPIDSCKGDK